jgi:hypothetical protein
MARLRWTATLSSSYDYEPSASLQSLRAQLWPFESPTRKLITDRYKPTPHIANHHTKGLQAWVAVMMFGRGENSQDRGGAPRARHMDADNEETSTWRSDQLMVVIYWGQARSDWSRAALPSGLECTLSIWFHPDSTTVSLRSYEVQPTYDMKL